MKESIHKEIPKTAKWLYSIIRFAYLLASAAVLPLAIYYIKYDAGGFSDHSIFVMVFIWIGALCFPMLHLFIEQYSYPLHLSGALLFTGAFLLNVLSGLSLSDTVISYTAYQVLLSSLIVQILFLSGEALFGYFGKWKENLFLEKNGQMLLLFAFYITALCFLLYSFISPLISQFINEKNKYVLLFASLFFGLHIYSSVKTMWSTYMNKMERLKHEDSFESWLVPTGIAMLISLVAAFVIALRD